MINYDIIAYVTGINFLIYILIHIPLDIITQIKSVEKTKNNTREYPYWEKEDSLTKIITLTTSLLFWLVFIIWPLLHILNWDNFLMFFNFEIPYLTTILQYIGLILINLATLTACLGRISRGIYAISWGVPNKLTTKFLFSIIRHPLYSSYCCYFLGLPLVMQNYLLLPLILGILGYYFTAKYEEKILLKEFEQEYSDYQKRVGMFIPFLGRRKEEEKIELEEINVENGGRDGI